MGLILDLLKVLNKATSSNNIKKDDKEKEMDMYDLEEWQKELVRKGEYEPNNFEEDGELDEDDYYYEENKR